MTSTGRPSDQGWFTWQRNTSPTPNISSGLVTRFFSARASSAQAWTQNVKRVLSANTAAAAAASAEVDTSPPPRKQPSHLIVMVNGLAGAPSNWDVVCEQLRKRLPKDISDDVVLHRSHANIRFDTWHGIDRCGQRLADEVRSLAAAPENRGLTRVSFVCHSMGGLMARYALGALFNPVAGTVAGLQPAHFITLATPHFGCDTDGVSAVPFISWSGDLPLLGKPLQGLLQSIAHQTGVAVLKRTGEQFFLLDGAAGDSASSGGGGGGSTSNREGHAAFGVFPGDQPLLFQMTQDVPEKGLYFYSALAAFKTRTAYANTDGDHLVGWANSSLRPLSGLPPLPPETTKTARGVVLEDPISAAWAPGDWAHLQLQRLGQQQQARGVQAGSEDQGQQQGSPSGTGAPQQHQLQHVDEAHGATVGPAASRSPSPSPSSSSSGPVEYEGSRKYEGRHLASPVPEGSSDGGVWHALRSAGSALGLGPSQAAAPAGAGAEDDWGSSGEDDWATASAGPSAARDVGMLGRGGLMERAAAAAASAASRFAGIQRLIGQNPEDEMGHGDDGGVASSMLAAAVAAPGMEQRQCAAVDSRGAVEAESAEKDLQQGLSGDRAVSSSGEHQRNTEAAAPPGGGGRGPVDGVSPDSRAGRVAVMLQRLSALPWRRIDVSFEGATWGLAHNNIQVTRRFLNFQGKAVPRHLVEQLAAMERLLVEDKQQQDGQQAEVAAQAVG